MLECREELVNEGVRELCTVDTAVWQAGYKLYNALHKHSLIIYGCLSIGNLVFQSLDIIEPNGRKVFEEARMHVML